MTITARVDRLQRRVADVRGKQRRYIHLFTELVDGAPDRVVMRSRVQQIINGRMCPAWADTLSKMEEAVGISPPI